MQDPEPRFEQSYAMVSEQTEQLRHRGSFSGSISPELARMTQLEQSSTVEEEAGQFRKTV
jgi:hypothetical protein